MALGSDTPGFNPRPTSPPLSLIRTVSLLTLVFPSVKWENSSARVPWSPWGFSVSWLWWQHTQLSLSSCTGQRGQGQASSLPMAEAGLQCPGCPEGS